MSRLTLGREPVLVGSAQLRACTGAVVSALARPRHVVGGVPSIDFGQQAPEAPAAPAPVALVPPVECAAPLAEALDPPADESEPVDELWREWLATRGPGPRERLLLHYTPAGAGGRASDGRRPAVLRGRRRPRAVRGLRADRGRRAVRPVALRPVRGLRRPADPGRDARRAAGPGLGAAQRAGPGPGARTGPRAAGDPVAAGPPPIGSWPTIWGCACTTCAQGCTRCSSSASRHSTRTVAGCRSCSRTAPCRTR